jgi:protein PhnA
MSGLRLPARATKVKGIRRVDGNDGHNVDGKTEVGSMSLTSEFLKNA